MHKMVILRTIIHTTQSMSSETTLSDIPAKIASTSLVLAADFFANGGSYGFCIKAQAHVKPVTLSELCKPSEWFKAYGRTWNVLKYGFYPMFLTEVALSEAMKQVVPTSHAHYSDFIMPAVVGIGVAPAASVAAINEKFPSQKPLNLITQLRNGGIRAVTAKTGGVSPIALREALFYYAVHDDSKNPFAYAFDISAILLGQPLSMFATNAAILKHQEQINSPQPLASKSFFLQTRLSFWLRVCELIISEGKKSNLSTPQSFAPGAFMRSITLLGTYGIFRLCSKPAEDTVNTLVTNNTMTKR
jgi:hypothetical protein